MERWRDIEGYEGLYQVSSCGRVKSLGRYKISKGGSNVYIKERIFKPKTLATGYLLIALCKEGDTKQFSIHRLVAEAFIPNPENLPQVNHKDEVKVNNYVSNLEWCTSKYNINYGTRNERASKKHSKKVLCVETNVIYESITEAQKQTGINHSNIVYCCKGKRKIAGGYRWRYVE